MKRFYGIAILTGLGTFGAMAQEEPALIKMKIEAEKVATMAAQTRIVGVRSALFGSTVKNAPYAATELTESSQVLADGTRIRNETRTQVYRDSEGRLRRETPNEITIWDPVANASYVLDPQKMTARKIGVGTFSFNTAGGAVRVTADRSFSSTAAVPAVRLEEGKLEETTRKMLEADLVAHKAATEAHTLEMVAAGTPDHVFEVQTTTISGPEPPSRLGGTISAGPVGNVMIRRNVSRPVTDALGKQMIEGVNADGTRITSTIEAGEIGNDRPIKIVSERWFSSELQTLVMSKQSDPRNGEESFKLLNVSRSEPAGYLFQVPAAYQMLDK